jgi:hypothetical protein
MTVRTTIATGVAATIALCVLPIPADAQVRVSADDEWCEQHGANERAYACEVREAALAAARRVSVDARPNGGIDITGSERSDILVRVRVAAWADSEDEARELVSDVRLHLDGAELSASGPDVSGRRSWSASFRLSLPTRTDLALESTNGGIAIEDVAGDVEFRTTNGGIHLEGLAGAVRGRTTNGGVTVALTGDHWSGSGLDVRTTNGGVTLRVPEGYSARLETGTTNGGMSVDFPITVEGRIGRRLTTDLGNGGPPITVVTTNGGVTVSRPE